MNWTRAKNVVWEELDGEALLVNPATGARWTLNATASSAWKLCDETRSLQDIANVLRLSYDSIDCVCRQLEQAGLLLRTSGSNHHFSIGCAFSSGGEIFVRAMGVGSGPRRRPSPRGISGPA